MEKPRSSESRVDAEVLALFSNVSGEIFEHPEYLLAGNSGRYPVTIPEADLMELPEGSKFFTMPGRKPMGLRRDNEVLEVLTDLEKTADEAGPFQAVSAFLPPGFLRTYLPACQNTAESLRLPLWAYCAVGWSDERGFVVPALQVDELWYWRPEQFDDRTLTPLVKERLQKQPENRLLKHLAHCALTYHCFAAKNLFYRRGEAPLPVAPSCNAACIGCLSLQKQEGCIASHERIAFVPSAEEICHVAAPHLDEVEDAIVSFGQGCEGDPILYGETLEESIAAIRSETNRGTINLNTNGSIPEAVKRVCDAGLDSIRISLNATDEKRYNRYYRPQGYTYRDVLRSMQIASDTGVHVAINLLIFPGVTDLAEEVRGLLRIINECGVNMIQLRNLNIDPDLYLRAIGCPEEQGIGISRFVTTLRGECPRISVGYFNRPVKK